MNPLISAAELVAQEGHVIVVDVRHDLNDPTAGLLGYASGHLPPGRLFIGRRGFVGRGDSPQRGTSPPSEPRELYCQA